MMAIKYKVSFATIEQLLGTEKQARFKEQTHFSSTCSVCPQKLGIQQGPHIFVHQQSTESRSIQNKDIYDTR